MLTEAIIARVYVHQLGQRYDQHRRELSHVDRDKECPILVSEVNRRIEYHKPVKFFRKVKGSST